MLSAESVVLRYIQSSDSGVPTLIFTVGIPGSGKSTWIHSQDGFEVVSLDDIRKSLGDVSDQSKDRTVVSMAKSRLNNLLR